MNGFIILLILYAILGTVISIFVMRRKPSQEDYFIGGRAVGWIVSALTYAATTYSAFMMVGLVGLSYNTGIGAFIFETVYLLATLILLSVYGQKIWTMGKEKGMVSPMELFTNRYGPITGGVGAIIAFIALIPYTSVQVIGLALILQNYGITFNQGIIIAVGIIAVWTFLGGLRGVVLTDAIQGFLMMAIAIAAVIWTGSRYKGVELSTFPNNVWTPIFFINLTLPWAFFALTNPQVVQRLFIIKDKRDFRKMLILFGVFGLVFTTIVTAIGVSAKFGTLQGILPVVSDQDGVIVAVMSQMRNWLAIPLALSIIFASVSTANSIILTLSSMMTRDVFRQKNNVWLGRGIIIGLAVLVGLFSLTRPNYLVQLSVASSRILMCFLPLMFSLFHGKRGGEVTGILTLVGGAISAILFGLIASSYSSLLTLGAVVLLYLIGLAIENGFFSCKIFHRKSRTET